jgi:thiamine-phosphate pyrophosphorylase
LQLRAKTLASGRFLELALMIAEDARQSGATFIVNDRADIAAQAAAGLHVGQHDLPPCDARRVVGSGALLGYSTHSELQIDAALLQPVSYIAVGPVFDTATKETGYTAVGLSLVASAARRAAPQHVPVVAIGGIALDTAPSVIAAGAASVAIITDLLTTDPEARVRQYLSALA